MALVDETVRRGTIPFGGLGASGTGASSGGPANLEASTGTRWATSRGELAPYPF